MIDFLLFFICSGIIIFCGSKLSKYGDIIAEKSGLGRTWIGVVLMASITSLPELITGLSSSTYADTPNIAVGDVLGSCVYNMFIIVLIDFFDQKMPVLSKVSLGNILSCAFANILILIVLMSLFYAKEIPVFGWIGFQSLITIFVYIIAMRTIFKYEKRQIAKLIDEVALQYENVPFHKALFLYFINAIFVVISAFFLPIFAERIALFTGLGQTLIGNVLVAMTTSLPEVVVSLSAIKLGAADLAIANLFGSNIFNIFILAIDDLVFTKGNLLLFAEKTHIVSAFASLLMTNVAIIDIIYRASQKRFLLSIGSWILLIIYLFSILSLYLFR